MEKQIMLVEAIAITKAIIHVEEALEATSSEGNDYAAEHLEAAKASLAKAMSYAISCDRG